MKKIKRLLSMALIGTLGFTAIGCSGKSSNENGTSNSEGSFEGETLTVGIWGGNDAESRAIEKVKSDFEEKTGATVELKVYTDYNTQIQADFIGKTAPDVFYMDANAFPFYDSLGVLDPLDKEEFGVDNYYSNLVDAFIGQDGELYSIPKDLSTLALYYNTELLESVGMSGDDIPTALEDFVTFLPELQSKLDEKYGKDKVVAMTYNQDLARNIHLLERDGASVIDENEYSTLSSDKVLENLEFIKSLVDTNVYKTPTDIGSGWNGEAFGVGKAAIMEEGNWVYGTLVQDYSDIKFEVKDMPSYKGEKSSMAFTVGYSIYSGSEHKELAKEWVKYATGMEGMKTWCSGAGTLPSRQDVAEAMNVSENPVLLVHLNQVDYARVWQKGKNILTINDTYKNFLPSALKGDTTLKDAMEKADKQANNDIENGQ